MPTVVVPYRGETAKQRLAPAPQEVRTRIAEAMLDDVLEAALAVGEVVVAGEAGGQGPAVEVALRTLDAGPLLVGW